MPLPRMTTRRWMVAVAVLALVFGGQATRRRWASLTSTYRAKAVEYSLKARVAELNALVADASSKLSDTDPSKFALADSRYRQISEHYLALARKYERAATRPWLPVASDPPPP